MKGREPEKKPGVAAARAAAGEASGHGPEMGDGPAEPVSEGPS